MKLKEISLWTVGTAVLLALATNLAAAEDTNINTLTAEEKAAGWQLLFNGTNLDGWHNFHSASIRAGWMVTNGEMGFLDSRRAGDIVSSNEFSWFELQLDYKCGPDCNSGIMYHVTTNGSAIWTTGPEFQLEDNVGADDPQRCGWLYDMYRPPIDPKTGKELDATKPVGEWNHVRLLIAPRNANTTSMA